MWSQMTVMAVFSLMTVTLRDSNAYDLDDSLAATVNVAQCVSTF